MVAAPEGNLILKMIQYSFPSPLHRNITAAGYGFSSQFTLYGAVLFKAV